MAKKKGSRALITSIIVLAVLLLVVATIVIVRAIGGNGKQDPYKETSSQQTPSDPSKNTSKPSTAPPETDKNSSTQPTSTIDPTTVTTIDIPPMNITVSYVKGIGAFEYEVLRTPNGTQYVDFRSADLAGTKCTDDQGDFASILQNPTSDEAATVSQKTTVDGTTYGLSLAANTCTSNPDLLAKYQKSFNDAFTLLKKM